MNMRSLAVLLLLAAACGKYDQAGADRPALAAASASASNAGAPVDDVLLAWLSAARSLHHEADLAEDGNDPKQAIAALDRLLAAKRPRVAPEIDEVLADTYARLGDLRSKEGDFEGAGKSVEAGLVLSTQVSYYRGHLLEVRGLVEERRAKLLAQKGDEAGAKLAREAAKKAFEEAVSVNFEFIDKHAGDGGGKK